MRNDNEIRHFVADKILFQYEAPSEGNYHPTIVIGLGGTGIKVLRYLKKHIQRNERQELTLLGIDSDVSENTKMPELPKLSDEELVALDGQVAAGTLAQASANPAAQPHVVEFLPNNHGSHRNLHHKVSGEVRANIGAGQFRRAGRLFFLANLTNGGNVTQRLRDAHARLSGIVTQQQQQAEGRKFVSGCRVYVVTSLAGGTGAGGLMDLLAVIRSIFTSHLDTTTVFGVLPGHLLDQRLKDPRKEKPQTRANAVGLLREIQGALKGELNTIPFQLGDHTPFVPGIRGLLEACYLIDQNLYNGAPPRSFLDLCNGVALFLYALVGSGVGSEQASGEINTAFNAGIPGAENNCFRALGVASIAYPLDDLEEYAIRFLMVQWLDKWLAAPPDDHRLAVASEEARTALSIQDIDSFASRIRIDIPDWEFVPTMGERNALLALNDHDFVAKRASRMAEFESSLRRYDRQIESLSVDFIAKNEAYLADFVRTIIGVSRAHAESAMSALKLTTQERQQEWLDQKQRREERIKKILEQLPRKENWIHINDWYDKGAREKYIALVQELFRLKYDAAFEQEVDEVLSELVSRVEQWDTWVRNLGHGFQRDLDHNRLALANIDSGSDYTADAEFGVVQSAMPRTGFRAWAQSVNIEWPETFLPARPDRMALVDSVWSATLKPFTDSLRSLSLLEVAKAERERAQSDSRVATPVLQSIRALQNSALPVIQLTDAAPMPDAMSPDKFVAGKDVRGANGWVTAEFSPVPGGRAVSLLDIGSQHFLLCVQTFKGFAAAHWRGFENAHAIYELDPWYSGVFPDTVRLSPLVTLGEADYETFKAVGLALMAELVVLHGDAYYGNLITSGTNASYAVFRKSPGRVAAQLVADGLLSMAPVEMLEPSPERRIESSLDKAVATLKTGSYAEFSLEIRTLFDRACNKLGGEWAKNEIKSFLAGDLGKRVAAGESDKKVREKIREALETHAGRL